VDGEADLIALFLDDLDGDVRGGCNALTGITCIGEDALDEGERAPRCSEHRSCAITILDARRVRHQQERSSIRVHESMALAASYLFGSVIAAWSSAFAGLDQLAVDDRRRWARLGPRTGSSAITRAWFTRSNSPSSRQAANQR
jgi:hypothetical protein